MRGKINYSLFLVILIGLLLILEAVGYTAPRKIGNPETFIKAEQANLESLDPHFMFLTASGEVSDNVFNSLLERDWRRDLANLLPSLATEVPSEENGLISIKEDGTTYITFSIRPGVKFHNGEILTADDVEYTFTRMILVGGTSSSIPILTKPLLGYATFKKTVKKLGFDKAFNLLDRAITHKDKNVTFKLREPFSPFLGLLADSGYCMGIFNKKWCIEQGDWSGTKETAKDHMNMVAEEDPLYDKMMGTGPFKLVSWQPNERIVLERFEDYWQGPARLKRIVRKVITEPQTAIMLLKRGDVDFYNIEDPALLEQIEGAPGIILKKKLPAMFLQKMNFVFHLAEDSKYIGDGRFGENGIPPDFFSDINVRKAFSYAFDYDTFINDIMLGYALRPNGPVHIGMPTTNPKNPRYHYDLEKAEEYFKKAWDGQVWEKGFRFTTVYASGSFFRQRALEMLKDTLAKINPKFHVDIVSLPWASYTGQMHQSLYPFPIMGLVAKFIDPYSPLVKQMHSGGTYANSMRFAEFVKEKNDALVEELGRTFNLERRKEISYQLQKMEHEQCLVIWMMQFVRNIAIRDWIQGHYPGPYPMNLDFYPIFKAYE